MVDRINREEGRLLAQDEFQRAMDELKAANVLHENGLYYKSVASAYYSVYHAAKALLLLKGVVPKSHEDVERMFSLRPPLALTISSDAIKKAGAFVDGTKRFFG